MKLLAISCYAPPQLTPQAIQVARLLYHLDADVTLLHGRDPRLADGFDQYPDFFTRAHGLAVPDPGPPLPGAWHRAALRALPVYGACPDLLGPWRRLAGRRALAHIAAHRPDALASFGMPMSDHLLGLALKRRTGLPWLVHFSDPWADNPFHRTTPLEHRINLIMERRVLEHADQVLFTSARTLELVMRKYPVAWRSRAAVLPHAWDLDHFAAPLAPRANVPARAPDLAPDDESDRESDLAPDGESDRAPDREPERDPGAKRDPRHVVRHIGACYGARSPQPLFDALARIAADAPRRLDGVRFELIGPVSPALLRTPAFKSLPPGLVSVRGQVGYRAALRLAIDASALLVIEAPSAVESVFLPSKLIDYIGARRPVWGIAPAGACAELIAQWTGEHACADPAYPATVAGMLAGAIDGLDFQPSCYGSDRIALRYAAARVAQTFKQYLRHAIGRRARAELAPAAAPSSPRAIAAARLASWVGARLGPPR